MKMRTAVEGGRRLVVFHCPGCGQAHQVPVAGGPVVWQWNGDLEAPTLSPSIKVTGVRDAACDPTPTICHSFVQDGKIRFCSDSTHNLAGQQVPLPDWPGDSGV